MALRFIEGFGMYFTGYNQIASYNLTQVYPSTASDVRSASGYYSPYSIVYSGGGNQILIQNTRLVYHPVGSTTHSLGFRAKLLSSSTATFLGVYYNVSLGQYTDGPAIAIYTNKINYGTTYLGGTPLLEYTITTDTQWHYYELQLYNNNLFTLKRDNLILDAQTDFVGSPGVPSGFGVYMYGPGTGYITDIYITDGVPTDLNGLATSLTGFIPSAYHCTAQTIYPTGDVINEWYPTGTLHYPIIDPRSTNTADSIHWAVSSIGLNSESFLYTQLGNQFTSIHGVQLCPILVTSNACKLTPIYNNYLLGTGMSFGALQGTTQGGSCLAVESNPSTSGGWSLSSINTLQGGLRTTSI